MGAVVKDDIEINQGEDWSYRWIVRDPETSEPLDLTGWSAKGEIRERPGAPVLYSWSSIGVTPNITLSDQGECVISVPNASSSAWTWVGVVARYDIELLNPSGKKVRLAEGEVTVSLEVTL